MNKLSALELFERRLMSLETANENCGHDEHDNDEPDEQKCYDDRQL